MPFAKRAPLLSVVIVLLCALLPTTFSSRIRSHDDAGNEDTDLIDLLKEVRHRLGDQKAAAIVESVRDTENEQRWLEVFDSDSEGRIIRLGLRNGAGLTEDQKKALTDEINDVRRSQGASNMYLIHWNEKLAKVAQLWADKCEFRHGSVPFNADEVGVARVGTNLYAFKGDFDVKSIVGSWVADKDSFDPLTQTCVVGKPCGAFNQLLNAWSIEVGCAMSTCSSVAGLSNANFLVCYFSPPGNLKGVQPFQKGGPACSTCRGGQFYCTNGLCDATCKSAGPTCECKADCQNCATQTDDCRCKCKPGSSGVNCGQPCKDMNDLCGQRRGGWPKQMCTPAFFFVQQMCPKMCGLCTDGTPCGREDHEDD